MKRANNNTTTTNCALSMEGQRLFLLDCKTILSG